jgi:hypothetical protein
MATIPSLTDEQRTRLLEIQFALAERGSEALAIHLGKAYLNQHDKAHLTVEAIPFTNHTVEELQDLLELRSQEVANGQLLTSIDENSHENNDDADTN